jgi:flagellar biosynthetic protein FliR
MLTDGIPRALVAVGLGAARTVPVTWLVSPLGGSHFPAPARIAFGVLLASLAEPALSAAVASAGLEHASAGLVGLVLARELLVGLGIGLVVSFSFRAAEGAGRLVDVVRGASMTEVLVPTSEERSSPVGALYLLLATLVFLELGGVPRLLTALLGSYEAVPLSGALTASTLRGAASIVIVASAKLLEVAVAFAAPVLVALWLTDLALGMIARVAPQVPVYFVGLPAKGLLGLGLVFLGLGALEQSLVAGLPGWFELLRRLLAAWS